MNHVVLYNNFTYSTAVLIFLSTLINATRRRYTIAFIVIMSAGLLLASIPSFIMPVVLLLLTLCFAKNQKEYFRIFYKCLTATTISFFVISTISALAILIVPNWLSSDGYNFFIGTMLLVFAIAVKTKSNIMSWYRELEHYRYVVTLEGIVLTFFSFVLPRYYPVISADSARQLGVFILSFMFVLVTVALLINRMKTLEYNRRELTSQIEQQKEYAEKVNAQFEKVITLKHYYSRLYHSIAPFVLSKDVDGLQQYFEKYITPIHNDLMKNNTQLSAIKNDLIRNLIEITAGQVATLKNVVFEMDIFGEIKLSDNIELDIFELLSNFIDNAIKEVSIQNKALLQIEFRVIDDDLSIQIANTVGKTLEIESLYSHEPKDGHGYGLKRVRTIVYQQPCIKHFTYKDGILNGRDILVQQIVITKEES